MLEDADAAAAVAEAGRRTTSRRELGRHRHFEEVSPEVGVLDPDAFAEALDEDPDEALAMLADLTGATDERLAELARELAGRIIGNLVRGGPPRRRGVGRLTRRRGATGGDDVDLDASTEALAAARAAGRPPSADDLTVAAWRSPEVAVCLLVDRSGSMHGARLAAAAVAAAAVAHRHGPSCSVVAFGDEAIVLQAQGRPRDPEELAGDLLRLRGHGTTDVALALHTARAQLERSTAARRVTVLLSDCRPTTGGDPVAGAAGLDEVAVVAPADDRADAEALAAAIGARCVGLTGPAAVPEALAEALGVA